MEQIFQRNGRIFLICLSLTPGEVPKLLREHTSNYGNTRVIEKQGQALIQNGFPAYDSRDFVLKVCDWGRGHRNLTRVRANNTAREIALALAEGYQKARGGDVAAGVLRIGKLKQIGISFASKQLRFLMPEHAVIMDRIIRTRMGYPENEKGYRNFLGDCTDLLGQLNAAGLTKVKGRPPLRVCDVEAAIFQKLLSA